MVEIKVEKERIVASEVVNIWDNPIIFASPSPLGRQTCSKGCWRSFPLPILWIRTWNHWSFVLLLSVLSLFVAVLESKLQNTFLHGNTWKAGEWILEGMHAGGNLGLLHASVAVTGLWWLWRIRNEALHSATFKPICTVFHLNVGTIWDYDMAKIPDGFRLEIISRQTHWSPPPEGCMKIN